MCLVVSSPSRSMAASVDGDRMHSDTTDRVSFKDTQSMVLAVLTNSCDDLTAGDPAGSQRFQRPTMAAGIVVTEEQGRLKVEDNLGFLQRRLVEKSSRRGGVQIEELVHVCWTGSNGGIDARSSVVAFSTSKNGSTLATTMSLAITKAARTVRCV
ncbi:hypothetical protein NE237_031818 [Protea cynaroides]|uniref:Uncharacterized protein n=1 Tax=Protea cynaroides TaxID=273540 RepID=A0A9Q0L2C1_9MAGN|nr:hypothetical protein NE237_031818 [Protea cynaroides]